MTLTKNILQVATEGGCRFCWIDSMWLKLNNLSQWMLTCHTRGRFARHLANIRRVTAKGGWRCCHIDSIHLELNNSPKASQFVQIMWICQHWIPQFNAKVCIVFFSWIDFQWEGLTLPVMSQVDLHKLCQFVNTEYPNLTLKLVLSSCVNRPTVRWIKFTSDELCWPVRIVSIYQHSMPLFNALEGRRFILIFMIFWQWTSSCLML